MQVLRVKATRTQ